MKDTAMTHELNRSQDSPQVHCLGSPGSSAGQPVGHRPAPGPPGSLTDLIGRLEQVIDYQVETISSLQSVLGPVMASPTPCPPSPPSDKEAQEAHCPSDTELGQALERLVEIIGSHNNVLQGITQLVRI